MPIERLQPFTLDIPKDAHWNIITRHIGYIKRYLLKYHNPSFGIYITNTYWPKMCLLTEKCVYCMKIFLLTEKVLIEWKNYYWLKNCILNENMSIEGS